MLQEEFISRWSLLNMFQINIGLADFYRSEAEARAKPTAGPERNGTVHIPLIRVYSINSLVSHHTAL